MQVSVLEPETQREWRIARAWAWVGAIAFSGTDLKACCTTRSAPGAHFARNPNTAEPPSITSPVQSTRNTGDRRYQTLERERERGEREKGWRFICGGVYVNLNVSIFPIFHLFLYLSFSQRKELMGWLLA